MKFRCSRVYLDAALNLLLPIVSSRSPRKALQCILLECGDEQNIILSATDLEIGIKSVVPVEDLQGTGSILISGERLAGVVRGEWNDFLEFIVEDSGAEIKTTTGRYRFTGTVGGEEFPRVASQEKEKGFCLPAKELMDALNKTGFAAARGDTRFAMNGVLVTAEKGHLEFVASDTHRLSLVKKKLEGRNADRQEGIIINKGVSAMLRLAEGQTEAHIEITQHDLRMTSGRTSMSSRLVEGQFPRYQDVVPRDCPGRIVVNRESLIRSLRLIGGISIQEAPVVIIDALPSENRLVLQASSGESGEGTTSIASEIHGPEVHIGVNFQFVLDVLKVLSGENVILCYRDGDSPIKIEEEDFVHVIMPIRLQG